MLFVFVFLVYDIWHDDFETIPYFFVEEGGGETKFFWGLNFQVFETNEKPVK